MSYNRLKRVSGMKSYKNLSKIVCYAVMICCYLGCKKSSIDGKDNTGLVVSVLSSDEIYKNQCVSFTFYLRGFKKSKSDRVNVELSMKDGSGNKIELYSNPKCYGSSQPDVVVSSDSPTKIVYTVFHSLGEVSMDALNKVDKERQVKIEWSKNPRVQKDIPNSLRWVSDLNEIDLNEAINFKVLVFGRSGKIVDDCDGTLVAYLSTIPFGIVGLVNNKIKELLIKGEITSEVKSEILKVTTLSNIERERIESLKFGAPAPDLAARDYFDSETAVSVAPLIFPKDRDVFKPPVELARVSCSQGIGSFENILIGKIKTFSNSVVISILGPESIKIDREIRTKLKSRTELKVASPENPMPVKVNYNGTNLKGSYLGNNEYQIEGRTYKLEFVNENVVILNGSRFLFSRESENKITLKRLK